MTMIDAIKKYAGVDFDQVPDDAAAKKLADEHHIEYEERHKKGDIVNLFFEEYCESARYMTVRCQRPVTSSQYV